MLEEEGAPTASETCSNRSWRNSKATSLRRWVSAPPRICRRGGLLGHAYASRSRLQEIQRITPSFAASMLEAARGVCDLVCGAVEQHYGSHATVEDMREALEDVDRCGSVAALDSQPHFAQGTYARYSVVAHPQALLASATSSPSAGSTLTSPEPGAGLGIYQAMTQAGPAGQRTPPATLVCGRKVKSTSKRCILAEGHRGHCRSIKPRAAR